MSMYAESIALVRFPGTYSRPRLDGPLNNLVIKPSDKLLAGRQSNTAVVSHLDTKDIQLSRRGDSEAFRRLIERYQEHVSKVVWRFSRDQRIHEELVQDVFVEAYLSLHSFRGVAPFSHWLSRIATRVGYHYWKAQTREQRFTRLSVQDWDVATGNTLEQVNTNDAAELMHRLLKQLPPRDRLVLTLRYIEEFDVAQTARQTGWSKTMVKVQTLRAKRKLEQLFREREEEVEK